MAKDDLDHIPSIVPTRDGDTHYATSSNNRPAGGKRRPSGGGKQPPPRRSGGDGAGVWARLFITVALVVAAVACAWAWQLQQQLDQAGHAMERYAQRIADLEDRLSDTDEGMNQNATLQAAKIRELDTEVRKLWDNVWKKNKERLGKLEATTKSHSGKIASNQKSLASAQSAIQGAAADLAKLKSVSGDLQRLMSSAKTNPAEVERVADALNKLTLEFSKLNKRVQSNEEWVGSVNAFRRQINATISDMQTAIRNLQAPGVQ
jgi:chromosome segregation ATPase